MAQLSISLMGAFQATLDGQPIADFESNKVRALLSYLAVEAERLHHRERLAELLWSDQPDRAALSNLRYALSKLRRAIGDRQANPPFLLITRETIQFNEASDYHLDVKTLASRIAEDVSRVDEAGWFDIERLKEAVSMFQGGFLDGFSVRNSPAFEEWVLFKREQINRQVLLALNRLVAIHEERREYEQAQFYVRRQLEVEPWQEEAHQTLMYLLALSGQRSAALAQYDACRRLLIAELGVEPSTRTVMLYESIRDGALVVSAAASTALPPTPHPHRLGPPIAPEPTEAAPTFVNREQELSKLNRFLERTLDGQGQVAFVTGETGSGKTALIAEFIRRALAAHGDVVAATGHCNMYGDIGDPYLPFQEILRMLCGINESSRAKDAISAEQAQRLWTLFPYTAQALISAGPALIDLFVPGEALVMRVEAFAPAGLTWRTRMEELVKNRTQLPTQNKGPEHWPGRMSQPDLFEQVTSVLLTCAKQQALILVLEDLQWADSGSLSLLFHLGRRMQDNRILLIGVYRPGEMAVGEPPARLGRPAGDWSKEPALNRLVSIINEFQRDLGDISVDLDRVDGRRFVQSLLDSAPNHLDAEFRDKLYRHTEGNPLFTVEMIASFQERGELIWDEAGRWVIGPALDWEKLPPRVEAVVAQRLGQLPTDLQAILAAACVEGETFTAEVVACALNLDEEEIIQQLSGPLSKQYRLVRATGMERLGDQRLSRYHFRHTLFREVLYRRLDEVERVRLHEATANSLEALYAPHEDRQVEISEQLASHYAAAGLPNRTRVPPSQKEGAHPDRRAQDWQMTSTKRE
jgi:DNA-binding SARP family transcriptional activator